MRKAFLGLALLSLLLSGCTFSLGGVDDSLAGGVFRSEDFGQTWQQKVLIPTVSGQPRSIAALDSLTLRQDPADSKALYFGSLDNGLFFSEDRAESWRPITGLGKRPIAAVAVNPQDKCQLYVGSNNKVWRSEDCGRNWKQIYSDTNAELLIFALVVDHYAPNNIFIANSRGEVIKSVDYGDNWRTVFRAKSEIKRLAMSHSDSRILMAATENNGIFRSKDGGENWEDMNKQLASFNRGHNFRDLVSAGKQPGMWLLATRYGLLRTVNDGDDWTALKLITPEKDAIINTVAVSPQDVNKIYYGTDSVFYSSMDGGLTWRSLKLPSTRRAWVIWPDKEQDGLLYLSVKSRNQ